MGVWSALRIRTELQVTENRHDSFTGTMSTDSNSASGAVPTSGRTGMSKALSLSSKTSESSLGPVLRTETRMRKNQKWADLCKWSSCGN